MQKVFVVLKLSALKLVVFPFFLSWLLYQFHIAFTAASMWHPKRGPVLLYNCTTRIFRRWGLVK